MGKSIYIENDGALFRGVSRGIPKEVWSRTEQQWKPYNYEGAFKPIEWGTEISEAEAHEMMGKGRNSDSAYDYPDIPSPSGLSEEYADSLRTPAVREAIVRRQADVAAREAAVSSGAANGNRCRGDPGDV